MDNKNADDFNVFSFDEFMNFTISDMDNAGVLEVVASGVAGDIEGPTPIVSPATSSPPDVIHKKATVDEHGFTEEDYDRLIENGDMSAILEDEVKEEAEPIKVPLIVEESMSVDKKLDFPLEPTEMTFELLRDWTMIRDGRKDALEEELEARLKDRLEELSANEEGATNGKMTAAFQSFLNGKHCWFFLKKDARFHELFCFGQTRNVFEARKIGRNQEVDAGTFGHVGLCSSGQMRYVQVLTRPNILGKVHLVAFPRRYIDRSAMRLAMRETIQRLLSNYRFFDLEMQ